jgi:hypothetical protein
MNISWFAPNNRTDTNEPQVRFASNPKGVKINKVFMEKLREMNMNSVRVGVSGSLFIIKEASQHDIEAFNITNYNKNNACIRSVSIHKWADVQKILGKNISGFWNEAEKQFEFNILQAR